MTSSYGTPVKLNREQGRTTKILKKEKIIHNKNRTKNITEYHSRLEPA